MLVIKNAIPSIVDNLEETYEKVVAYMKSVYPDINDSFFDSQDLFDLFPEGLYPRIYLNDTLDIDYRFSKTYSKGSSSGIGYLLYIQYNPAFSFEENVEYSSLIVIPYSELS